MVKYISIENFKAIKKLSLGLGNLNLFFGMNGMGKSSIIQSILLCRQSFWKNSRIGMDRLYINGDLIELGTSKDIRCSNSDGDRIAFVFGDSGDKMCMFAYGVDSVNDADNTLYRISTDEDGDYSSSIFGDNFVYLSAEHLGPQRKYDYSRWNKDGINNIGNKGEYAVPFLAMNGDSFDVSPELCSPNAKTAKLMDQVSGWMNRISPGARLSAELIRKDQEARLGIAYEEERLVSEPYAPINVGFGIPYVLPVIIALLTANEKSLILIENPESHLHPKGQSSMAELMCKCAACGAQIICESHSDHIINGVRVAVKESRIDNDDVTINYFSKDANMNSQSTSILVDENGNLSDYPDGLLDEWGDLMAKLM